VEQPRRAEAGGRRGWNRGTIPAKARESLITGFAFKIQKNKRTAGKLFKVGEKLAKLNPSGDPAITYAVDLLVKSYETFMLGANGKLFQLSIALRRKG
jgi:hypothetical protein